MKTTTKRARTNPNSKEPAITEAPKATPVQKPSVPKTIDLIADAVGEMLSSGTDEYCLDRLLKASISHITRRSYERGIGIENENAIRETIDTFTRRHFVEWKSEVMAGWRRTRKNSASAVEPKTVTDRIRGHVRETLEWNFEKFLGRATPEELRLMDEVMHNHNSYAPGVPIYPSAELPIAQAFELELGRDAVYIRIPEHLRDQVDQYVRALVAIEDKAA